MYDNRLKRFRKMMLEKELDAFLINKPENYYYISGYTGEGAVIITQQHAVIITDSRYTEQAKNEAHNYEIVDVKPGISPCFLYSELIKSWDMRRIGYENHCLTVDAYDELKRYLKEIEIVKTDKYIEELRIIKDTNEIDMIKKAQNITDKTFAYILQYIRPGVSEKDLACEMEHFIKKNGAKGEAFETIVVSGQRSSLPHGQPSNCRLQLGDFITLDFGARFSYYCSDMTRTVFLGRPDEESIKIYNIVLEAQKRALDYIRPGLKGKDVDKVARHVIEEQGFGSNFSHGLGHGVGIEIHEEPRLSPTGERELLPGMVVTVEPGLYFPDFCGVRIEDMVIITEDRCDNLTKTSKELMCIK